MVNQHLKLKVSGGQLNEQTIPADAIDAICIMQPSNSACHANNDKDKSGNSPGVNTASAPAVPSVDLAEQGAAVELSLAHVEHEAHQGVVLALCELHLDALGYPTGCLRCRRMVAA